MLRTLYGRLALALLAIVVLLGAIWFVISAITTEMYWKEVNQRLNWDLASNLVKAKALTTEGELDRPRLAEIFGTMMKINPSIEIYLIGDDGRIIAYDAPAEKIHRNVVSVAPIRKFLRGDHAPIVGDDPRSATGQKIFAATPVAFWEGSAKRNGYLYVILSGEEYDSIAARVRSSYILQMSVIAGGLALLFSLGAGLVLFRKMTRRLRILTATVDSMKQNDFAVTVPMPLTPRNDDEIDRLGMTIAEMSDRIMQQLRQLRDQDRLRRELVANVSHDLRTPLASLQGYLETLLLKRELTPEEQKEFLEIAARQSERLGTLIDELFELAKLDARETPLQVEPFSMAELVQDVVMKYRLNAEKRGIHLQADFGEDLPLVTGDIALMERVLENLLENAMRYTPAGGEVRVELLRRDAELTVRVVDTGCGISEESLPYIFDRFYRAENNNEERKGGAGLGLAIAQRILELHGTRLMAESRLNIGTTFSFSAPNHLR